MAHCPAGYGIPGQSKAPRVPSRILATAQQEATGQLTFYSNGWLTLVAERGWHCSGVVGATGALSMALLPTHAGMPSGFGGVRQARAVSVYVPSPGTGEVGGAACPFFPEATPQPGWARCPSLPANEKVTRLSGHAVAFEDPPHIRGSGDPSGGPSPAYGVVSYKGSVAHTTSAAEQTCTLPHFQHAICTLILNDFIRRYPL